ncbi:hypothetical protein BDZ89DRAFT_568279 [Hymenopellis radicata]|nr:hypothetical protein BDZ89DRAFT_568279 [Hymenopellis radicata]
MTNIVAYAVAHLQRKAPILSLPLEIVLLVFRYILASYPARSRMRILFKLCSIYRPWGDAVIQDGSLWTDITIEVANLVNLSIPSSDPKRLFTVTYCALTRTKEYPLDITIVLPDVESPETLTREHCTALACLLIPYAHRIRSLKLKGNHWPFHVAVMEMFSYVNLPMLQSFVVTLNENTLLNSFDDLIEPHTRLPMFHYPYGEVTKANRQAARAWAREKYPALQSVGITGAPYTWTHFAIHNLSELRLVHQPAMSRPSHTTVQNILSAVQNTLELLAVDNYLDHADPDTMGIVTPVVLSKLRSLVIGYSEPGEVATFLEYIEVPSLSHLSLVDKYVWQQALTGSHVAPLPTDNMLLAMLHRLPLSQLKSLSLDYVLFESDSAVNDVDREYLYWGLYEERNLRLPVLLQFIQRLVSLEDLRIRGYGRDFLKFMNYPADRGKLMSPLKHGRKNLYNLKTVRLEKLRKACDPIQHMTTRAIPLYGSAEEPEYQVQCGRALDSLVIIGRSSMPEEDDWRLPILKRLCPTLHISLFADDAQSETATEVDEEEEWDDFDEDDWELEQDSDDGYSDEDDDELEYSNDEFVSAFHSAFYYDFTDDSAVYLERLAHSLGI